MFNSFVNGSTFHSGRWWTAVSPGDELAEVEGQPVQPAREGGRGGEGRSGRGWPGEVSWAILPKARAMQYHQKPEEKKPPLQLQLTGPQGATLAAPKANSIEPDPVLTPISFPRRYPP